MKLLNTLTTRMLAVLLAALMLGAFTACDNDDDEDDPKPTVDTTKPVISLQSPSLESVVEAGQTLQLKAVLTDDQNLSQLRINIHNNFDGHDHGKTSAEPFDFDEIVDLSGTTQTVERGIEIPADAAAGPYHLMLYCLDASGNEADFVEAELIINSAEQPVIEELSIGGKTDFSGHTHMHFEGAETIEVPVMAHIEDPDGDLEKVKIEIKPDGHHHKTSDGDEAVFEWENHDIADKSHYDLNETLTLNKADFHLDEHDHFIFRLIAEDEAGNHSVVSVELHVE